MFITTKKLHTQYISGVSRIATILFSGQQDTILKVRPMLPLTLYVDRLFKFYLRYVKLGGFSTTHICGLFSTHIGIKTTRDILSHQCLTPGFTSNIIKKNKTILFNSRRYFCCVPYIKMYHIKSHTEIYM